MPGRHCAQGPTPQPYVQVVFDSWARQMAGELMEARPGWWVVWGPYWRCWSAYALFTREPLVLRGVDAEVLEARMRQVEEALLLRRA